MQIQRKQRRQLEQLRRQQKSNIIFFSSIMMGEHFESESGLTVFNSLLITKSDKERRKLHTQLIQNSNESNSSQFRRHDIVTNLSLMPALQEQSVSGLNFFEVAVSGENDLQELMFA